MICRPKGVLFMAEYRLTEAEENLADIYKQMSLLNHQNCKICEENSIGKVYYLYHAKRLEKRR